MFSGKVYKVSVVVGALLAATTGCNSPAASSREIGVLSGGALGAGLGAIVGNQVGDSGPGIAIGSAFGAVAGGLIGNALDGQDAELSDRDRRIKEQERLLAENRKLIEELRARGADVYETDRGVVVNLPDVLFAFDSAALNPSANGTIAEVVKVAKSSPNRKLSVEGHTDSVGSDSYNSALSKRRADSVAAAISSRGVPSSQLSAHGFGKTRPLASNSTSEGRARNRRVEVVIEN